MAQPVGKEQVRIVQRAACQKEPVDEKFMQCRCEEDGQGRKRNSCYDIQLRVPVFQSADCIYDHEGHSEIGGP